MAPRKTERLLNLTILLLSSRRFVPKERIRENIEGYRDLSDDAFARMFERDKDELRALGVPIETGSNDQFFDDETGYKITRRDFELPPIDFTPDEATVLGLAATVWQQASAAEDTAHALAKLRAAGIELDASRLTALDPQLNAREEAFEPLRQAMNDRQAVRFIYREGEEPRIVEPWRLTLRVNSWYLIGFDRTRQAPRVFKLSRFHRQPTTVGPTDAFQVPSEEEINAHADIAKPGPGRSDDLTAVLAIRGDRAPGLRRRGEPVTSPIELPAGFAAYEVSFRRDGAASEIAMYGPDVVVCEPDQLRADVVAHLRGVLRAHGTGEER